MPEKIGGWTRADSDPPGCIRWFSPSLKCGVEVMYTPFFTTISLLVEKCDSRLYRTAFWSSNTSSAEAVRVARKWMKDHPAKEYEALAALAA